MPATSATLLPLLVTAVEHASDAVVITSAEIDPPGPQILYVNPAFCSMTGYGADELLGQTPRMLQGPQTDRAELDRIRHAMHQGQPYQGESINYRKNGQPYYLRWHMDPVRDTTGAISHWVAIQRDVTAEYAAQAERAQLLAAAQAALVARDQFLAVAAHELRTPLTSLLGYAYLMPKAGAQGPDALAALAQRLTLQVGRFKTLIEHLLDVSQLQRDQFDVQRAPLDLVSLVTRVVDEVRPTLPVDGGYLLTVQVPDAAIWVCGDAIRLEQVLVNLLSNAVKYSAAGSSVAVRLLRHDDAAVLEVQDQGIGIPPDTQARLFEPYFRAEGADAQAHGFGLGLYIVNEIVTRHGGTIEVTSVEGQGSTFRVTLPLDA